MSRIQKYKMGPYNDQNKNFTYLMPYETQKVVSMYNQGIVSMCEELNELTQSWLYILLLCILTQIYASVVELSKSVLVNPD